MALIKIHHGYAGNLTEFNVNDFAFVEIDGIKFSIALLEKLAANVGNKFEVISANDGIVVMRPHQCGGDKGEAPALKPTPTPVAPAVVKPEVKSEPPKVVEPPKVEAKVEAPKAPEPTMPV